MIVTPIECQYRDKPAHVAYSIGKYRKEAKSAALGFTKTINEHDFMELEAKKGWSRLFYQVIATGLVITPFIFYKQ